MFFSQMLTATMPRCQPCACGLNVFRYKLAQCCLQINRQWPECGLHTFCPRADMLVSYVCVCVTGCIDIVLSDSAQYTDQLRACYHAELIDYCYTPCHNHSRQVHTIICIVLALTAVCRLCSGWKLVRTRELDQNILLSFTPPLYLDVDPVFIFWWSHNILAYY